MRLIGIDGGGTKTAAILFDEEGHVLAQCAVGPCNPNVLGFYESTMRVKKIVEMLTQGEPRSVAAAITFITSFSHFTFSTSHALATAAAKRGPSSLVKIPAVPM